MTDQAVSTAVPTVSVVIPCYNYGRFLSACVQSVVNQSGVDVRVLIIDDCSTDGSDAVADALAATYDNVEVRHHAQNMGHIATYNEGLLEWADGDFVTLLSADDELTHGSLARSTALLTAEPTVGMVYGGIEEFGQGLKSKVSSVGRPGVIVRGGLAWLKKRAHEAVNTVPTPGTVLRTSVQKDVGGYDPQLAHAGDFDMWMRVAAVSDIGYVRGLPQGRYRHHGASMSDEVYADRFGDLAQRKLVFDSLYRRAGDALDAAGIDRRVVYARLAGQALWWGCRLYEKSSEVDGAEVAACVRFAAEACPEYASLPEFRALQRRQRLGAAFCHRTQIFVGSAVVRRLKSEYWWFRWRRYGG